MSNGAFRLLVILCRYANNETGMAFPSHSTLAELMGQSKGSVSAYLKELRRLELVESIAQRGRGGGNGKRHHVVKWWRDWRGALGEALENQKASRENVQRAEHSVQPAERVSNNQNHSIQTTTALGSERVKTAPAPQSTPQVSVVVDELMERWVELTRGASWSAPFNAVPSRELVAKTEKLLEDYKPIQSDTAISSTDIERELRAVWSSLGVETDQARLREQVELVAKTPAPGPVLPALSAAIKTKWRRGVWRRMPAPHYFREYLAEARSAAPSTMTATLKVLRNHLRKYTELYAIKAIVR